MIEDKTSLVEGQKRDYRSFNPAICYEHPYYNFALYGINLMHIWYDVNKIFNEVFKRTSYIGKNTLDKNGMHTIDTVAMTPDEKNDMFRPLMIDAHSVVFENLKPFTHGLRGEVMRYRDSATGEVLRGEYDENENYSIGDVVEYNGEMWECVSENRGRMGDIMFFVRTPAFYIAEYWIEKKNWFNPNAKRMLDNAIHEAIIAYIMHRWFLVSSPQHAEVYLADFNKRMDDILNTVNSQEKPIRRKFRLF